MKNMILCLMSILLSLNLTSCNNKSLENNFKDAYFANSNMTKEISNSTKTGKERGEILKEVLTKEDKIDVAYVFVDGRTALIGIILKDKQENVSLQPWKELVKSTDHYVSTVSITTNSYLVGLIKDLEL